MGEGEQPGRLDKILRWIFAFLAAAFVGNAIAIFVCFAVFIALGDLSREVTLTACLITAAASGILAMSIPSVRHWLEKNSHQLLP